MAAAFVSTVNSGLVIGTLTVNLPAMNVVAGNCVLVTLASDTNDISSVTDTAGNTWTRLINWTGVLAWSAAEIWISRITTGHSTDVITITRATSANSVIGQAFQYSGLGDIAPTLAASANGTGVAVTSVTSGSFNPTAALNLAQLITASDTGTYTAGTNYTLRGPSASSYMSGEDRIAPPSGSQTAAFSHDITDLSIQVVAVQGAHNLSGAIAPAFGLAGQLSTEVSLSGAPAMSFGLAGGLTAEASLSGAIAPAFGLAGQLNVEALLAGAPAMSFSLAGSLVAEASLSGLAAMTFGVGGSLAVESNDVNLFGSVGTRFGIGGSLAIEDMRGRWAFLPGRGPWLHRIK